MQKLRNLLPGTGSQHNSSSAENASRNSINLEPEVGFQITIESIQQQMTQAPNQSSNETITIPELNVHLLAARHLPNLFGFKIVQGYQVKVKLFPGSKRLDSSIQTNSWPKFNENFRFSLVPDLKPSLKHSMRRSSKSAVTELFTPEEVFAGQFVVFTVYALLELPPASFSRFNKTYRSLRDKSSNLVQKVVESSNGKVKDEKENNGTTENGNDNGSGDGNGNANGYHNGQKSKRKPNETNARDLMPPLTIGESRRNLGSVTCYLEPKIFKRSSRTGLYETEELWLPIKDITTTAKKNQLNDITNAPKGIVEIILEVRDTSQLSPSENDVEIEKNRNAFGKLKSMLTPPPTTQIDPNDLYLKKSTINGQQNISNNNINSNNKTTNNKNNNKMKNKQWNRMTAEVKRKIGFTKTLSKPMQHESNLILRITTARMRCTQKVKDELECTAGNVYVKTAVFEHGIFIDSWKSPIFYPSLSTKWNINDEIATLEIPLQNFENLENLLIRTTLATKTKMGKKLILGTVLIGTTIRGTYSNGVTHMQQIRESPLNEEITMWHKYQ